MKYKSWLIREADSPPLWVRTWNIFTAILLVSALIGGFVCVILYMSIIGPWWSPQLLINVGNLIKYKYMSAIIMSIWSVGVLSFIGANFSALLYLVHEAETWAWWAKWLYIQVILLFATVFLFFFLWPSVIR